MASTLHRALEQHSSHFATVNSTLGSFKAQKAGDVRLLRDQLAVLAQGVSSLQAMQEKAANDVKANAEIALSGLEATAQAYAEESSAAAAAAQADAAAAVEALISSINAQAEALQELAEQHSTETKALQSSLAASLQEARTQFASLSASTTSTATNVRKVFTGASCSLAEFASSFQTDAQQKQETLLAQISSMLAAYTIEQNAAVASAVDRVQSQLGAGGSAAVEALNSTKGAADAGENKAQVSNWGESVYEGGCV